MSTPSHDGWTRCPPGAFRRVGAVLAARHLRRLWLTRLALAAGAVLMIVAGWQATSTVTGWTIFEPSPEPPHSCAPGTIPTAPAEPSRPAPGHGK
jgi:hypothetical protein